jgi:hypothetical protein
MTDTTSADLDSLYQYQGEQLIRHGSGTAYQPGSVCAKFITFLFTSEVLQNTPKLHND